MFGRKKKEDIKVAKVDEKFITGDDMPNVPVAPGYKEQMEKAKAEEPLPKAELDIMDLANGLDKMYLEMINAMNVLSQNQIILVNKIEKMSKLIEDNINND